MFFQVLAIVSSMSGISIEAGSGIERLAIRHAIVATTEAQQRPLSPEKVAKDIVQGIKSKSVRLLGCPVLGVPYAVDGPSQYELLARYTENLFISSEYMTLRRKMSHLHLPP